MHCKQAMIVYAIRHAPTGNLMPARMFRQAGSGWSWWEPTETRPGYLPHDTHPRLFFTRASAANALGQWLRGPLQKREVGRGYMSWGEEDSRTEVGAAEHDPLDLYPPRRREDMVLVPFTLVEA